MDDTLTGFGSPHERDRREPRGEADTRPLAAAAPEPCPDCGSPRVIPVVYGSSSPELIAAYAAGRIAIGGARAVEGSPRWECRDCDHRWTDAAPGDFG